MGDVFLKLKFSSSYSPAIGQAEAESQCCPVQSEQQNFSICYLLVEKKNPTALPVQVSLICKYLMFLFFPLPPHKHNHLRHIRKEAAVQLLAVSIVTLGALRHSILGPDGALGLGTSAVIKV